MIRWILSIVLVGWCGVAFATDYTQYTSCKVAYLMESSQNPLTDASTNNNSGTANNNPTFSTTSSPKPYSAGYYTYSGTQSHYSSGAISVVASGSMMGWFVNNASTDWTDVLSYWGGSTKSIRLEWHGNTASVYYTIDSSGSLGSIDATTNVSSGWHHYTITWNSGEKPIFYIDAQPQSTATNNLYAFDGSSNKFYIAERGNTLYVKGSIDEPAMFSEDLTSSDISDIKDNGLSPTTTTTRTIGWTIY
jgi:hypothetical protein